jgi:uncharacterized protein (DUF1778 family)
MHYDRLPLWSIVETTQMPNTARSKDHPLSMRLPAADVALIDRAAGMRGRSRTDFVREAAVRAAEDVIMERALIQMSSSGFSAFMKAIAAPGKPVPELVEVLGRPAPWETGGSHR